MFKKLFKKIKASRFWGSVAILSTGSILGQAIGLLTTPITSRIYTPSDYGQYGLIASSAAIIISIISLGLYSAIMVAEDERTTSEVFSTTILVSSGLLLFIILLFYLIMTFSSLNQSIFNNLIYSLFVFIYAASVNLKSILTMFSNKKGLYKILFANSLISAITTLAISIPFGILIKGPLGLIFAAIISNIIAILQMWLRTKPEFQFLSIKKIVETLVNNKDFILFQYPSNFVESLATQIPNQTLIQKYGDTELGSYNMNEKILGIPSRIVGAPLNQVYFKTAADRADDHEYLSKLTFSLVSKIMILAIAPIIILSLFGGEIFEFVLGNNWKEAGELSAILILVYVFSLCATVVSYCRVAIGKQKFNLLLSIIKLIIIVATFIFISKSEFSIKETLILFTIVSVSYHVFDMFMNFFLLKSNSIKYLIFSILYVVIILVLWKIRGII